jgi:hypothetical protein
MLHLINLMLTNYRIDIKDKHENIKIRAETKSIINFFFQYGKLMEESNAVI